MSLAADAPDVEIPNITEALQLELSAGQAALRIVEEQDYDARRVGKKDAGKTTLSFATRLAGKSLESLPLDRFRPSSSGIAEGIFVQSAAGTRNLSG